MLRYVLLLLLFLFVSGCPEDEPAPTEPIPAPAPAPEPKEPTPAPVPIPKPTPTEPKTKPGHMTSCYEANASICAIEQHIFELSNEVRAKHDKPPFGVSYEAAYAARNWSAQQAAAKAISHEGFAEARNAFLSKNLNGLTFPFRGENVAMFTAGTTLRDEYEIALRFVNMWENSSGHLRNILSDAQYLGSGVVIVPRDKGGIAIYATQLMHN